MGAVRMKVQTPDKNITIIHKVIYMTPKSYVFVINKFDQLFNLFKTVVSS